MKFKIGGIALITLGALIAVGSIPVGIIIALLGGYLTTKYKQGTDTRPIYKQKWAIISVVAVAFCCMLNVSVPDPIATISADALLSDAVDINQTQVVNFKYSPADANTRMLEAVSSDPSVATIDILTAENGAASCEVKTVAAGITYFALGTDSVSSDTVKCTVTDFEAEKKAEEERIAAEKKAEEERVAAEKKAEEERIAKEKAEQERVAAEQAAAQKAAEEQAAQEQAAAQAASTETSQTVYVTNTGKKYHRSGCQYLKKSKIAISLSDAKSSGYTACSKCF